jgi:outer membrane receptor protein involved in Fe transport
MPGVRIVPGVRIDYFSTNNQAIVQPRVSARWEFVHDWTLKGGAGVYAQPPAFDNTSTAPNTLIPGQTIGNPNLAIERSMHYALGLEHNFTSWFTLAAEGFYKTIDGIAVATSPELLFQHQPPYVSTGTGRVYGFDMLLRWRLHNGLFGWVAYTLMRSERRDAPGQDWFLFDYDQTHILTIVASYELPLGFRVGLRFRYVTGTPATPVVGAYYNADSMLYVPIEGARNSVRVADFHQLDVRIDKRFRFSWGSISAFLEVLNVYNQPNQEALQYNYNYTQHGAITGLPIFPNIGLRGEL